MRIIKWYSTITRLWSETISGLMKVSSYCVIMLFVASPMVARQSYTNLSEVINNLDVNLVGAGARAEGLGGAFIGVADDATSILWNPAGLATLERPEASIVTRLYSQRAEYTDTDNPTDNNLQNSSQLGLNFGSLAYPLQTGGRNVVLAVAYQQQINLRKVFKTSAEFDYENTGGVNTISPGIGVKLAPLISIGVAANFWFGHFDQSAVDWYDIYDTTYTTILQHVITHNALNATVSGTNFVLGLLVDFSDIQARIPFKFGVSLKTPFDLKQEFSGTFSDPTYGDVPYNGTRTTQMPLMLGFGASYQIGDNFTIAADYEMREFKDKKTITVRNIGSSGVSIDSAGVTESNENLNQFRIGAEYLIVTTIGVFPLRAGFRTVPTVLANQNPYYDSNFNYYPGYSGQVSGNAITIGTGYISERFALDAAYASTSYSQSLSTTRNIKYSTGVFSTSLIIYF
jgi:opacity protein-like surface antigen